MNDCIFCQIIAAKLPATCVYQDEKVIVIRDIHPQARVHLLAIPKTHVKEFTAADGTLIAHIMQTIKRVIEKEAISAYRLVTNGKGAALVDHFHIHILGNVEQYRKL